MKSVPKWKKIVYIAFAVLCFFGFLYHQNNSMTITNLNISSNKLPVSFEGYRIVHLSDLHSKSFGKNQKQLVRKVNRLEPNLILFTGDLIDSKKYREDAALTLMEEMIKIAPVYFVTGNHEWWSGKFDSLEEKLRSLGVHVMRNEYAKIEVEGEYIYLIGIDDPAGIGREQVKIEEQLATVLQNVDDQDGFKLLLAHRPEMFSLYSHYQIDLIFSGHAHGGQVRLPFIGGIIAPNQGFFPTYTAGAYISKSSTMIVSRGLGNSIIPQRIFNRPEIVSVTLRASEL